MSIQWLHSIVDWNRVKAASIPKTIKLRNKILTDGFAINNFNSWLCIWKTKFVVLVIFVICALKFQNVNANRIRIYLYFQVPPGINYEHTNGLSDDIMSPTRKNLVENTTHFLQYVETERLLYDQRKSPFESIWWKRISDTVNATWCDYNQINFTGTQPGENTTHNGPLGPGECLTVIWT